jgi:uncharacterized protein YcgI (DUF1989 family)
MIFLGLGVIRTVKRILCANVGLRIVNQILTGEGFDFHCHSNLTRAIIPYHLTEFDVHDVLNVVCPLSIPDFLMSKFQCTGLNTDDQYFMKTCPAKVGDYFEFFAEIGETVC